MIFGSIRILPWVLLAVLAGCSTSKEDADAGLDASTDTDTDTDTDADTDADGGTDTDSDSDSDGGTELTIDIDCTDPAPVSDTMCNIYSSPCDEGAVCSELLWLDESIYSDIIESYCYPECAEEEADAGVDDDAGPFSPCGGSNTSCIALDETAEACLPLGQVKAEFEIVVAPVGEIPESSDFPFVDGFACATPLGFGPAFATQIGEVVEDSGVGDSGTEYTTDAISFYWNKPKVLGNPHEHRLNVSIPGDGWFDGAELDLSEDPEAFGAWLVHLEYGSFFDSSPDKAWIEAIAVSGRIVIENAADPCSGDGCEAATGTMDIVFGMGRAQLDLALFE